MIHVIHYEDKDGNVYDVEYFCCKLCLQNTLTHFPPSMLRIENGGRISYGACPGGAETNDDVHCPECGELLWKGLRTEKMKG